MTEVTEIEWNKWQPPNGDFPSVVSRVNVRFALNSKGEISEIKSIRPSSGMPPVAVAACVDALKANAPFPPWTPTMIAALGDKQEFTFEFDYQ